MKFAAATVAEIEELVKEILVRIPTKALLKFKCVSKQWLSWISDPYFCAAHARFQQNLNCTTTALFHVDVYSYTTKYQVIPLKYSPFTSGEFVVNDYLNVPRAKMLQSCNGLLLCYFGFSYFICNPTTRQFKELSLSSILEEKLIITKNDMQLVGFEIELLSVCLVFDPIISPHYKVIVIPDLFYLKDSSTYCLEIWIYSSEFDTWTFPTVSLDFEIFLDSSTPPKLGIHNHSHRIYCNGSMHWLRYHDGYSILCFDVDTMIFKKIYLPWHLVVKYFGESQGHLHCITYHYGYDYPKLDYDVMEIAPDYSGWCVIYHVNLRSINKTYRCHDISFLSIIHEKNAEEMTLAISVDHSLMAYDLSNGTHRRIYDSEYKLANSTYRYNFYPYVESLICV